MFESPIFMLLAYFTSIAFTIVAATIPPGAGNLVAAIFLSSMGCYLGGEEAEDSYEQEIADADI